MTSQSSGLRLDCPGSFVKQGSDGIVMPQRILIGTDEAGYGPNLGPLTVTATAWEIPAEINPASLWDELRKVITNAPARGDDRLFVADSKAVYSAGDDLENLEVPVLAFLRTLGHSTSFHRRCRWTNCGAGLFRSLS